MAFHDRPQRTTTTNTYDFHAVQVGQNARRWCRLFHHQHLLDGIANVFAGSVDGLIQQLLAGAAQKALRIRPHPKQHRWWIGTHRNNASERSEITIDGLVFCVFVAASHLGMVRRLNTLSSSIVQEALRGRCLQNVFRIWAVHKTDSFLFRRSQLGCWNRGGTIDQISLRSTE